MSADRASPSQIEGWLFPDGRPDGDEEGAVALEQYKLMLGTIESLESKRQALHTFFMSINTLLLAAIGLVAKESLHDPAVSTGVVVLATMGGAFSICWFAQIQSHGKVLSSKWEVFNYMEQTLPTRPFSAEYGCLLAARYRSFTKIESAVPVVFTSLYLISLGAGVLLRLEIV